MGTSKLMAQYKKWARQLLKVNPDYVTEPYRIVGYIKGPNWDDPEPEYAHYRDFIRAYGPELLEEFEAIRALPRNEARERYRKLFSESGIKP